MEAMLRVQAPFAAFRQLQAGAYQTTSPTIPPSAAWGLVLNCAAIETRDATSHPITLRRADAPRFQVAIGELGQPQVASLYQQLHGYPVGNAGKKFAAKSQGSKYWIKPVRREVLINLDLVIAVRELSDDVAVRIGQGLSGKLPRYGLPFLGDNNFLIDRIEFLREPLAARWFCQVDEASTTQPPSMPPDVKQSNARDTSRLTIDIDRKDSARNTSYIYERMSEPVDNPPKAAWTWVPGQAVVK